jgi:hypothetical protein
VTAGPINLSQVRQKHKRFLAAHKAMVDAVLHEAGEAAKAHVRTKSTFKRRSARSLKDRTRARVIRTSGGRLLRLQSTKRIVSTSGAVNDLAPIIEFGSRPHVIEARFAFALAFKVRGQWVRAFRVNHPGTRPYYFLRNARQAAYKLAGVKLRSRMRAVALRF